MKYKTKILSFWDGLKIPILILILLCAFCMFFPMAVMADIPDQTWTCVGSAAVPDESSLNKYDASGGWLRIKGGNTGTITARCNVTGFETCCEGCLLEVVYEDPGGGVGPIFQKPKNTVLVKLIEVSDSGQETVLATFNSNEFVQGPGVRENSVILDLPYDESKAHYVEINVFRTSSLNNNPGVLLVRLFCTIF